jgi:transformation/transcription domain-associated protein
MTAMLVKYHYTILQEARKDIIKFGWTYIRLKDVINKHAAYVIIGYSIAHYEIPAEIVQQVYCPLLKTNWNEGRALVPQALDLIAPVLPQCCNVDQIWAASYRVVKETNDFQQMTNFFHFLVKHVDLFYQPRGQNIIFIVDSLRQIAQPTKFSAERKKLALNLLTLIFKWEKRVEGKGPSLVWRSR